jgi:hypothetical protein
MSLSAIFAPPSAEGTRCGPVAPIDRRSGDDSVYSHFVSVSVEGWRGVTDDDLNDAITTTANDLHRALDYNAHIESHVQQAPRLQPAHSASCPCGLPALDAWRCGGGTGGRSAEQSFERARLARPRGHEAVSGHSAACVAQCERDHHDVIERANGTSSHQLSWHPHDRRAQGLPQDLTGQLRGVLTRQPLPESFCRSRSTKPMR